MGYRHHTLPIVLAVALFAGCSCTNRPLVPVAKPISTSPARQAEILQAAGEVKPGMTPVEVEELMGKPDEVQPLYEPVIKNPKPIGTTHWYVIERSTEELAKAKAVRVSFDLDWRVSAVDRLGLDDRPPAP